jgi:hypothetical protein
MLHLRTRLPLGIWLAIAMTARVSAGVTQEQVAQYRELRREFFLVIALPPGEGDRPRKEHRRYLKAATRFAKTVAADSPAYAAAADYLRARMLLKIGDTKRGRDAFDSSLRHLATAKVNNERVPPGMPSECAVRVFRAFSFFGDGNDKVLEQLEAIEADIGKPRYHEVGAPVNDWAEALETRGDDAMALRVYLLIKRWDLWQDEAENPERRIRMIRMRLGEEAPPKPEQPVPAEPNATEMK